MKGFFPQPDSSMMKVSLQVERRLDGQGNFCLPKTSTSRVNFFCHISPCSGSGDMKVMQFKVETGQKVLDLKVDFL